jgi:hypothetical protein
MMGGQMPLGMPQAPIISAERLAQQQKVLEGKADAATLALHQQQSMMETYQQMIYHQQMFQHYQAHLAQ